MTDSKTVAELRLMARLVREYDYAEISRMLRKAADEIEQAIAATLGSGTLTAEQVRKAIFNCSTYASYDGCTYHASGIRLQAIVDELNATLGRETCHPDRHGKCSNCGKQIGVVRNCEMYIACDGRQAWKSLDHEVCDVPNYCPNCGAKVINEVDNAD